jgi:hypothetical protein
MDLIQVEVHDAGARASLPGAFVCLSLCESLSGTLEEEEEEREEDEQGGGFVRNDSCLCQHVPISLCPYLPACIYLSPFSVCMGYRLSLRVSEFSV